MYSVELYNRVRRACHVEGMSKSEAARKFGIDRKTVAKILKHSVPPGYRRSKPPPRPKLDPFIPVIDQILEDDKVQPTLSRFTAIMSEPSNRSVLREAALELGARGARAERGGKRPRRLTLDVDSLPIEVHGHQAKAEWNGHYAARIYHPLVTSVAETGDMLDARLRAGNVGTADGALDVILDVVDRAQAGLCEVAMVRIDAGFPSASLLAGLEARGIDYVARLKANPALDRPPPRL